MLVSIANAEHYVWGEHCDGWHLLNHEALSVIQERVPPGKAEVRHYHEQARQFFFILRGTATMHVEAETVVLREGEGLEIPPHVPHLFRNASEADVVFLVISAPTTRGDR
jgi:mannose-6-phosphate isomerase-like protein (cupin superfamily)